MNREPHDISHRNPGASIPATEVIIQLDQFFWSWPAFTTPAFADQPQFAARGPSVIDDFRVNG